MKKINTVFVLSLIFSLSVQSDIKAQDDCCGVGSIFSSIFQSGIYGGYGLQSYNPEGWNHYVGVYNQNQVRSFDKKMSEFGTAYGYKLGANILGFQQNDIVFYLKVSYNYMKEKNESKFTTQNSGQITNEFDLRLKTFGTGIGLSYVLNKSFDIKIIDFLLTWTSVDLYNRFSEPGKPTTEQKLTNPENALGFSAATGILYYPLPPYLSIEANVGYSFFSVDVMAFDDGTRLQVDENTAQQMDNFISSGGFFAFAQLNLAFPF